MSLKNQRHVQLQVPLQQVHNHHRPVVLILPLKRLQELPQELPKVMTLQSICSRLLHKQDGVVPVEQLEVEDARAELFLVLREQVSALDKQEPVALETWTFSVQIHNFSSYDRLYRHNHACWSQFYSKLGQAIHSLHN